MTTPTQVSLVRHGAVHNPGSVFYGRLPGFDLSAQGQDEVRRVAATLRKVDVAAVYTSPLLRARQTAREILLGRPTLELRVSNLLNEVRSPFDGRPSAEVDGLEGDVYTGAGPSWEQPPDLLRRVRRFLGRVRKSHPAGHVVAVTHGDPIVFLILWAHGWAPTPENKARIPRMGLSPGYPPTGSVTTLTYRTGEAEEVPEILYRWPDPPPR